MIASDNFDIQVTKVRNKLLHVCLERRIPFVSYQLPETSEVFTLVQHSVAPRKLKSSVEITGATGFVVAPFEGSDAFPITLLEPDFIHSGNSPVDQIIGTLQKCSRFLGTKSESHSIHEASSSEFTQQVEAIKAKIKEGIIIKAVLSRVKIETEVSSIDTIELFNALCQAYPHAFVYMLQMPEVGCWIGASPEPLLLVSDERAKTTSIAGTQVLGNRMVSDVKWNAKERDEQAIVTSYIEKVISSFGITNVEKIGPYSYQAANLVHLKTQFEFDASTIKPLLGKFIVALQPTPSVCGLPKANAVDVVRSVEKHEREYYSGFLGPINIEDNTAFFVNLRCLKVVPEGFAFFVGAGITEGSIPGQEWEETSHKMMTLLSVVNSVNTSSKAYVFSKTRN